MVQLEKIPVECTLNFSKHLGLFQIVNEQVSYEGRECRGRMEVGFTNTYMQSVSIIINVVSSNPLRRGVFDTTLCDKVCQ